MHVGAHEIHRPHDLTRRDVRLMKTQAIAQAMWEVQKNQSQNGLAKQRHRFFRPYGRLKHACANGLAERLEHLSCRTGKIELRAKLDVSQCGALEKNGKGFLHDSYVEFEGGVPVPAIAGI